MSAEPHARHLLAVDLGGTKVAVALVSDAGKIVLRQEQPTCQLGPEPLIGQIVDLLQALLARSDLSLKDILATGVGIPAVLEPGSDHVIWAPNLNGWRDVALRPALEGQLGLPVFIEYDGHAAVLGEWWLGAGRGYQSVAMVIVGTGIGGGLILDGRLYRGRDRLAGAAGWFAMTSDAGLDDARGHSLGHWESLAAGPGIARLARSLLDDFPSSRLHRLGDTNSLTARQIFEAARSADALALKVVNAAAGWLGLGVANIVSLVNPELVILGGSVGRQGDLLLPGVREVARRWAQPASAQSVEITCSQLGADAGLLGAAYAALTRTEPYHGVKGVENRQNRKK